MVVPTRSTVRVGLALVALVALMVVLPGMGNGFAYDDVPIIVDNTALHSLSTLPTRLVEPYWPSGLYRPVTLGAFGLEWTLGAGSPIPFRIVSTLLYLACAAGVLLLALRLGASVGAASLAALVFAVHPVHSEVSANTVGQAELLSALFALAAMGWYLRARQGGAFSWRDTGLITLLALLSAHSKESGYAVFGLLVAVEVLVVRDPRPWGTRWSGLRGPALLMVGAVLGSLAVRLQVLGSIGGELPHQALAGLSLAERGMAMLATVPEWARLLLWPAHLRAEYGPPEVVPQVDASLAAAVGALMLGVALCLMVWTRTRAPLMAMGIAWMAIALAPVANFLVPTGILLAERTMFLPSVGLCLMVAGLVDLGWPRLGQSGRRVAAGAGLILLAIAAIHSARRQPVWTDTLTILTQSTIDAPRSYRAHHLLGKELLTRGDREGARASFETAATLWAHDPRPFEELGQLLRAEGRCAEALPILERGVLADSMSNTARSRLVECLIVERRWDEAEVEIQRGLAQGVTGYARTLERLGALRDEVVP